MKRAGYITFLIRRHHITPAGRVRLIVLIIQNSRQPGPLQRALREPVKPMTF